MDIIHDEDAKTVMAIIGDVSQYEGGAQTVNLHDYNTVWQLQILHNNLCSISSCTNLYIWTNDPQTWFLLTILHVPLSVLNNVDFTL